MSLSDILDSLRFADLAEDEHTGQPIRPEIKAKPKPKKPRTKTTVIPDGWVGQDRDSECAFVDDAEIEDEITETTIEDILNRRQSDA